MKARRHGATSLKCWKKGCECAILYTTETKNESKIQTSLDEGKLRELIASRPALREMWLKAKG